MNEEEQSAPTNLMQEVLLGSNVPVAGPGRTGGGGGVVPPILLEENRVPKFYHEAITACGATTSTMLPNTALVYNMMVTSGLPRPVLSYVWSAVNRTLPGQLTRPEFFSCLALIALAQKNETIAAISSMTQLPIPFLQSVQVPSQNATNASSAPSSKSVSGNITRGYFLPTALLPSPKKTLAKSKDLIGDFFGQGSSKTTAAAKKNVNGSVTQHSYNDELSAIDWCGDLSAVKSDPRNNKDTIEKETNPDMVFIKTIDAVSCLFEAADKLCSPVPSDSLSDLFKTERGSVYLICLSRAYRIIERVQRSSSGLWPPEVRDKLHLCERIWAKLSEFVNVGDDMKPCVDSQPCGICRQPSKAMVEYGGKSFHPECANLWVNCIDPILPTGSF